MKSDQRRLAYRDSLGAINLNLCERSLSECGPGDEGEQSKLSSWARHARRAIAARPLDEGLTLSDMLAEEDAAMARTAERELQMEALPISLRKPKRRSTTSHTEAQQTPPHSAARSETSVVLQPMCSPSADDDGSEENEVSKVARRTVSMPRRLFRTPQPGDEPLGDEYDELQMDSLYLRQLSEGNGSRPARRRRDASPSSSEEEDGEDVYEVEAILKESDDRFLIRWFGYGPEHDSWEPEDHVAPALIEAFRTQQHRSVAHAGGDYREGQTARLWCHTCGEHRSADTFSAHQRRVAPCSRACLRHHYRIDAPATPSAVLGRKRQRDEGSPGLAAPPAPKRAVAPQLSARHADLMVAKCRLYGFSMC